MANFFERIFTPDVIARLKRIESDDELIIAMNALLGGTAAKQVAKASASGLVAVPVINMTFDPESINKLLVLARWLGKAESAILTASVTATAGATTYLTVPAEEGKITVAYGGIGLTTDYVSNAMTMVVTVDGHVVTPPPYEYVFNRDTDSFDLGEFYYIERYLEAAITNLSATNADISFKAPVFAVDAEFFNKTFYKPLVNAAIQAVENLVGGVLS